MKYTLIFTFILLLIAIFFPLLTLTVTNDRAEISESITTVSVTSDTITKAPTEEITVSVFSNESGKVEKINLKDYLLGAVSAEMPASFHEEALKAQTVASYTYLKWIKENSDNPEKYNADITDASSVHQSFLTDDELKEKWGTSYDIYYEKINKIIDSVMNEYLTYEGKTAMTVFHAVSPGQTQSSQEVWTNECPYLTGVSAPGDSLSPYYRSEVSVSEEEFIKKLGIPSSEDTDALLSNAEKNDNGRIINITSGDKTIDKTELRSLFSLNSPYFEIKKTDGNIIFTVYGKGHGVGMSQYSADYMARQGSSYKEILSHFYKGTKLTEE